jgi:hypothetical protein
MKTLIYNYNGHAVEINILFDFFTEEDGAHIHKISAEFKNKKFQTYYDADQFDKALKSIILGVEMAIDNSTEL